MRNILRVEIKGSYTNSGNGKELTNYLDSKKIGYGINADSETRSFLFSFQKPDDFSGIDFIESISDCAEILNEMRKNNMIEFARITTYYEYKFHYTYIDEDYSNTYKKELISILEENI